MDFKPGDRPDLRTYRIRVALIDSDPEIWRLLEVPAALPLSQLHEVIQAAMGWRRSHQHVFISVDQQRWGDASLLEDGLVGRDERDATLAEVLTEESGPLIYEYDFGDGWEHVVELIEVIPAGAGTPPIQLIRGDRRAPLEDSGGVDGYAELVAVLADPEDEEHSSARAWVDATRGPWLPPFDPAGFDLERTRRALTRTYYAAREPGWSSDLTAVVSRLFPGLQAEFAGYLDAAQLDRPVVAQATDAEAITRPYRWLLGRLGANGVKLTAAGWLPPAVVAEAMRELNWGARESGTTTREDGALPVMNLRQSANRVGLIRKQQRALHLTTVGRRLAEDPPALCAHLARRWIPSKRAGIERDAATLLAVALAVGGELSSSDLANTIAYGLDGLGWVEAADHGSVSEESVWQLIGGDLHLFADLGLVDVDPEGTVRVPPAGRDFARAMLTAPPT
ncbi:MAG: plasmid pRiA4b family protein [Propionibacteriaceae bacterium]|jgi:hypothetical protein|nr:plasmid pRiA4b family protein [Propionibacteriaceae bacterium]